MNKTSKWEYLSLALIVIAVTVRYFIGLQSPQCLSIAPGYVPDDFGVIGLMSKHTLELGEFPFFFWGQDWFGGMEAFMHGIAFWIFGVTPWAMRMTPLFLYALFCALTYLIARDLFNERVGFLAVLWCAFAPIKISELSVVPHTHYMETPVLGSFLLWLTIRLVLTKSERRKKYFYALLGLFSGLSWWITPLIVFILLGIALFLLCKEGKKAVFGGFILALPAFMVGALPYIVFFATTPGSSYLGMGQGFHLEYFFKGFWGLITFGAPEAFDIIKYSVFGAWGPWAAAILYLMTLLFYIWKGEGRDFLKLLLRKSEENNPRGLLLFCLLSTIITYSLSKFAAVEGVRSRYIIGLHSLFPVIFAFTFWEIGKKWRWFAVSVYSAFLLAQGTFIWAWGVQQVPVFASRTNQILKTINFIKSKGLRTCYSDNGGEEYTFLAKEKVIFCPPMRTRYRPYELVLDAEDHPAFLLSKPEVFKNVLKFIGGSCKQEAMGTNSVYYDFQESPWQYRQVNAKEIRGTSSHRSEEMLRALDRDMGFIWNSGQAKGSGMWVEFDLEKEHTIGMVRFWNPGPMHRCYPGAASVEVSRDGKSWEEVMEKTPTSLYYWSGPRIYYWEWGSRWEVRFGPVQARFIRIKQFEDTYEDPSESREIPWMIQEAYIYEITKNDSLKSEGTGSLSEYIRDLKFERIFADRWMSAKIREMSHGTIETVEPFTYLKDTKGISLKNRLVKWNSKTGFVLEDADADEFERMMEEGGIPLKRRKFGRWELFYFEKWGGREELLAENKGWWWMGLGVEKINEKSESKYLRAVGDFEEKEGNLEQAQRHYKRALEVYQNNQGARVGLIDVLKMLGKEEEAREQERELKEETQPKIKCEIEFEKGLVFLGYSIDSDRLKAGQEAKAKYYWRLNKDPGKGIGILVHIEGQGKFIQGDHKFLMRHRKVWPALKGEVFSQEERIRIPQDAMAGEYEIKIGVFDLGTGKRNKVIHTTLPGKQNRVLVGKLWVDKT